MLLRWPSPVSHAEHLVRRRQRALLSGRNPELDERHETPVRALPLLVRVEVERRFQQRAHDRPFEDLLRIGVLAEEVAARQVREGRLG